MLQSRTPEFPVYVKTVYPPDVDADHVLVEAASNDIENAGLGFVIRTTTEDADNSVELFLTVKESADELGGAVKLEASVELVIVRSAAPGVHCAFDFCRDKIAKDKSKSPILIIYILGFEAAI